MGKLLEELKRRKVVRVAGVYAVVAWLLIQVSGEVLPTFNAPQWVQQTITFLFFLGFPIALVLAWAYEVTPEGIKPDFAAQSAPTTTNNTDRKLIYATFALVLLVAMFQIGDRFIGNSPTLPSPPSDEPSGVPQLLRTAVSLGELGRYPSGLRSHLALSPDGRWLAYTIRSNEIANLRLHDLVSGETRTLVESTTNGLYPYLPVFSPEGEQILHFVNGTNEIHVIPREGGRSRIFNVNTGPYSAGNLAMRAPAWLSEESIVFTNSDGALERLDLPTGEIVRLETPRIEGEANTWPRLMGDGPWLLYTVLTAEGFGSARLDAFDINSGEVRNLVANGYNGHFLNSGHLVYMRDSGLWAVSIDEQQMQIKGGEILIEDRVETSLARGIASYTLSESGRLVYLESGNTDDLVNAEQWVLSSVTGERQALNLPFNAFHPVFSPDGEQVAVTFQEVATGLNYLGGVTPGFTNIVGYIALYHIADGSLTRRSFTGSAFRPKWTPDGKQLVYGMFMDNAWGLWMRTVDGSGQPRQLLSAAEPVWPESITPDGTSLVYGIGDLSPSGRIRMQLMSLLESGVQNQPLIDFGTVQIGAAISPDGRFIAYAGNEISGGIQDIIVRPFPAVNDGQWQITGGRNAWQAIWESSGKSLFFGDSNGDIYRVPADPENDFRQGTPELVFDSSFPQSLFIQIPGFAVSPDGQRVLYRDPAADNGEIATETTYAVLVDNWTEKLRQLVPASN